MKNWSLSDVLALARLSSAAYDPSSKDSTNAIAGMEWIGQVGNPQCQATIARWGGFSVVCFRGTQVAENLSIPELWDDLDPASIQLAFGVRVSAGFWSPMAALWQQVQVLMPDGQPLLTGHSLGGVRAQLAKALLPSAEVVSFGAPRGADDPFWWWAYDGVFPLRVVHESDFAPDWSPGLHALWTQPGPMMWLRQGRADTAYARIGVDTSILHPPNIAAHSIDSAYAPALEKLAA